mmetsp:Transcript_11107/g.46178  ORF Transcript_11107/g.46178 Transcript_11107/m.46178 type:complete len:285 (-) Transcript_11107:612-1466(-)
MRLTTLHSTTEAALGSTTQPLAASVVPSMAAKRSSPGAKGLLIALMYSIACSSLSTLRAKSWPLVQNASTARSFLTATVRPGGTKVAWLTQLASMPLVAPPSFDFVVSTHSEPTTRPIARSTSPTFAADCRCESTCWRSWRMRLLRTAWPMSVPLSSHTCRSLSAGVNLTRMGSNASLYPPSRRRRSSSSTASPDQPKEPNTPQGFSRVVGSDRIAPSASLTGVGMWPPIVGLPMAKASHSLTAAATSVLLMNSQLRLSTPTPVLMAPRAMACASDDVFPYADA